MTDKKMQKKSKKLSDKELAESFVFRNTLGAKAKLREARDIAAVREKLKAKSGKKESIRFKLLQLKYQMEDFINKPFVEDHSFGTFLKQYIEAINVKQIQLAEALSIDKTYLSQLINKHRLPSEEVLIRLEIHSGNLINAVTWYKLAEKEKENEISTNKTIREKEKKFVKSLVGV
jgi:plasmid maintenance system antidote protein VapI